MAAQLWIDGYDYAVNLLRGGEDPWAQPDGIGTFCGEILTLLSGDKVFLPLLPLLKQHAESWDDNPEDRVDAINDAVEEGALLDDLAVALASMTATGTMERTVLLLPGPALALGSDDDEDALDLTALAVGDVLRKAGGLSLVRAGLIETSEAGLEMAATLFRIAEHFGIELSVLDGNCPDQAGPAFPAADRTFGSWFVIQNPLANLSRRLTACAYARPMDARFH